MDETKLHEQGITLVVVDRNGVEDRHDDVIDFGPVFDRGGAFKEPITIRVKTEEHSHLLYEEPKEVRMVFENNQ